MIQGRRQRTAVKIINRVVLTKPVQESRSEKVRVVEHVEELCAKLNVEGFRDSGDREVLKEREKM